MKRMMVTLREDLCISIIIFRAVLL